MPRYKNVEEQIAYVVATDVQTQCEICGAVLSDRDAVTIQVEEGVWVTMCSDFSQCKENQRKNSLHSKENIKK